MLEFEDRLRAAVVDGAFISDPEVVPARPVGTAEMGDAIIAAL